MDILTTLRENAKKFNKRIVLAEGTEERTLKAADFVLKEKMAKIILLGDPAVINEFAAKNALEHIKDATIINPLAHEKKELYTNMLFDIRKAKGMTMEQAAQLVENPLYLAVMMLKNKDADGEVAGAINSTGNVLRPALQIIKTLPGISVVSGGFLMVIKDNPYVPQGVLFFADSGVHPNPTDKELAEIAVSSAGTMKALTGIDPVVAMLSFSTKGSAKHELVDKVISATKIAKEMRPDLLIDGELQGDSALVPSVGASKAPGSEVAGKANVLVFPDLNCGNIAYKLVQRLAGATAIGPLLQGIAAPINDLSRGCTYEDIVDSIAITVNEAAALDK